jgi:hypothetical protein
MEVWRSHQLINLSELRGEEREEWHGINDLWCPCLWDIGMISCMCFCFFPGTFLLLAKPHSAWCGTRSFTNVHYANDDVNHGFTWFPTDISLGLLVRDTLKAEQEDQQVLTYKHRSGRSSISIEPSKGGFLKWVYPKTMGFNTKIVQWLGWLGVPLF